MPTASALRLQIEAALAHRIPAALTPAPRGLRPVAPTGIANVDALLDGGIPLGAITELVGPECSGRTSLALSFLAGITQSGKVCAWIDVSNSLQPESAAAAGLDLSRLLWVRCGAEKSAPADTNPNQGFQIPEQYLLPPPIKKGLHGGSFGPHPRHEVKGLSSAVSSLLAPRCAEPQRRAPRQQQLFHPPADRPAPTQRAVQPTAAPAPWTRLDQALRATDLLLQGGGFSAIVLDMSSLCPEHASRVPLATWFRYRAAAERSQASILLLTQYACAKSSAELHLRLAPLDEVQQEATVWMGVQHRVEVERQRFTQQPREYAAKKSPSRETAAQWQSRSIWAGPR